MLNFKKTPIVVWVILLIIIVRLTGILQPFEWSNLDVLFQLRPLEKRDERIVIVGIEESDIQSIKQYPLSDEVVANLIKIILDGSPRVIGLDIYRDIPVPPGHEKLNQILESTPNLIGVHKALGNKFYPKIAPPPVLASKGQIAAADAIVDGDGVLRRGFLFPVTREAPIPSLGLAMALQYLSHEGITPKPSSEGGWLKLKNVVFHPFRHNDGGYVNADDGSYQILINWRGGSRSFQMVTVSDVLNNKIAPNLFTDKAVFIGSTAISIKDFFNTPYSRSAFVSTPIETYGVEIQANITSLILGAVLDERPLLSSLPEVWEYLWLLGWTIIPLLNSTRFNNRHIFRVSVLILLQCLLVSILLLVFNYFAFSIFAWWLPTFPVLLSLWLSSIVRIGYLYITRINDAKNNLERQVKERTEDLSRLLEELKASQQKIIAQEKLAYLGLLIAGITHELKNPINLIKNFNHVALTDLIVELEAILPDEDTVILLKETSEQIAASVTRAEEIMNNMLPKFQANKELPKPILLNDLIDQAIKLVFYSKRNQESSITVETEFSPDVTTVEIYPSEFTQALINLIDNAYNAALNKQSGDEFQPMIKITTIKSEKEIIIHIEDNGIGISSENKQRIFEPFFTTKTSGKGTGLGLAIAHDIIVGKHQGSLDVESRNGEYTRFIIKLQERLPG